jgi:hypothetical protein
MKTHRINRPFVLLAIAWWALAACAAAAPGEGKAPATRPAADEATVRAWFADLANRDASVREEARTNLMGLPRHELPLIQRLVEEGRPLVPSQVAVLREIVAQVYLAGEPYETNGRDGFLGIMMSRANLTDLPGEGMPTLATGVVVESRKPGFGGCRMLRDGDVLLGLTDRPEVVFRRTEDLQNAVRLMRAGQTLKLDVLRHGQVRHVAIVLDPRPAVVEAHVAEEGIFKLDEWVNQRMDRFNEYWRRAFAPLLKEDIS